MNEHESPGMVQPEQKRYLAQWLRERDVEHMLTATDPEDNPEFILEGERPCEPHAISREPIEPGQIRLLARGVGGVENRLMYVAVMSLWNEDPKEWLIAPFSAYTTPALTGEYLIRPDGALSLRVLCLWNSRNLSENKLSRSWLVDGLTDQEMKDASAMLRYALQGDAVSTEMQQRIGAPILNASDPRRAYQQEEVDCLDQVQQADESVAMQDRSLPEGDGLIDLCDFQEPIETSYALAAADADLTRPLKMKRYATLDNSIHVVLAECETPGFLSLEVRKDDEGELEKGVVTDQWGRPLAVIEQGCARLKTEPGLVIRVYNRSKKVVLLECARYE